jgi:hypothetical protein
MLLGVASFVERPAGKGFNAFQLNVLIRGGGHVVGVAALVAHYGEFVQWERHCGIDVGRLSWIEGKFRLGCRVDRVGNSEVVLVEVCRIVASSGTPEPSGRRQST